MTSVFQFQGFNRFTWFTGSTGSRAISANSTDPTDADSTCAANPRRSSLAHADRAWKKIHHPFLRRSKSHSAPAPNMTTRGSDVGRAAPRPNEWSGSSSSSRRDHGSKPDERYSSKYPRRGTEWDKYRPSTVVKDYAAVSTQNSKFRKYMEDECVAIPHFKTFESDSADTCFFGVYDGHGGSFCSQYAAKNFHARFATVLSTKINAKLRSSESSRHSAVTASTSTDTSDSDGDILTTEDIENSYVDAFAIVDAELTNYDECYNSGSTAVTCLIRKHPDRTTFHVANIGDSRAILYSAGQTTRLSVDHKATNKDEVKRIRANNGIVFNKRVAGILAVTRAFGHVDEKKFITSDPHLQSGEVEANKSFLILCSDGISDVFSDDEVTQFVSERLDRGEKCISICKQLLDEAKTMDATDNMTVVLICFADVC